MDVEEQNYVWHKIGNEDDSHSDLLLGKNIRSMEVQGKTICLTSFNNRLYAFESKCPHAGASLEKGRITPRGEVVCFLHRYAFRLENGHNTIDKNCNLTIYPVREDPSGIYVGFVKPGCFSWI